MNDLYVLLGLALFVLFIIWWGSTIESLPDDHQPRF